MKTVPRTRRKRIHETVRYYNCHELSSRNKKGVDRHTCQCSTRKQTHHIHRADSARELPEPKRGKQDQDEHYRTIFSIHVFIL